MASTAYYTFLHTLALPPLCRSARPRCCGDGKASREGLVPSPAPEASQSREAGRIDDRCRAGAPATSHCQPQACPDDGTGTLGRGRDRCMAGDAERAEENTSELQSLMRTAYDVFCMTKKTQ